MNVTVRNRQSRPVLTGRQLAAVADIATRHVGSPGAFGVAFVDDAEMARFHAEFSDDPTTTDVLSFPTSDDDEYRGDVIICADQAMRQAVALGVPYLAELAILALHGFLHVLGYDHVTDGGEMTRLEQRLRPPALRQVMQ